MGILRLYCSTYGYQRLLKLEQTVHMSGNVGLVTFIFNHKKEITDKMENAIYHWFFPISKKKKMPPSIESL